MNDHRPTHRTTRSLGWSALALTFLALGACASPSHHATPRHVGSTADHDAEIDAMVRRLVPIKRAELRGLDVSTVVVDPHGWAERTGFAALDDTEDPAPAPTRRSDPAPEEEEPETRKRPTPAPKPPVRRTTPPRPTPPTADSDTKKPTLDDLGLPKPKADGRAGTRPAGVVRTNTDRKQPTGPYAALEREAREVGDMTFKLKDERRQLNRLASAMRKYDREDSAFNRVNLEQTLEEYKASRCNQHTSIPSVQSMIRSSGVSAVQGVDVRQIREEEDKLRDTIDAYVERRKSIVRLIMAKRALETSDDPKARQAHDEAQRKYEAAK